MKMIDLSRFEGKVCVFF